jgi:hypothetical protein
MYVLKAVGEAKEVVAFWPSARLKFHLYIFYVYRGDETTRFFKTQLFIRATRDILGRKEEQDTVC